MEPPSQRENVPAKTTFRNETNDLEVPASIGWFWDQHRGEALFLLRPGPKSLRPLWMVGLVQGATHILLELACSLVVPS